MLFQTIEEASSCFDKQIEALLNDDYETLKEILGVPNDLFETFERNHQCIWNESAEYSKSLFRYMSHSVETNGFRCATQITTCDPKTLSTNALDFRKFFLDTQIAELPCEEEIDEDGFAFTKVQLQECKRRQLIDLFGVSETLRVMSSEV